MPLATILPPRRVHVLGGVSDAGKTRFVLPAMMSWQGAPPWVYIVGDRTLEDAQDTMRDCGIDPKLVPTIPGFGADNLGSWPLIRAKVDDLFPQAELLVIEGFQDLCPGQGRKNEVRDFLSDVHASLGPTRALPRGRTILGIVESPKLKPNERYSNPRQRISGPSGWGFHTSTVLLIESAKDDDSFLKPERVMWVCCKGQQRRKVDGAFNGRNSLEFPTL